MKLNEFLECLFEQSQLAEDYSQSTVSTLARNNVMIKLIAIEMQTLDEFKPLAASRNWETTVRQQFLQATSGEKT